MQNVKWFTKPLALFIILCMVLGIAPAVSINLPSLTMTAYAATPAITFTDSNFKAALIAGGVDTGGDGEISDTEAAAVTTLDVSNKNISSIDGIEYFTSLTKLWLLDNRLTSLDISNNTVLEEFSCANNRLTSLDVSNNPALTVLHCFSNQLASLDVSSNQALTVLDCHNNRLTSFDVSNNPDLIKLGCFNNQLTSLDVSSSPDLNQLACDNNQLTSLDVSNNTTLIFLSCSNNKLTALDVSNNTTLGFLACRYNNMTSESNVTGLNRSITTDFYFSPQNGSSGSSSSRRSSGSGGSGGSGAGAATVISTYWIETPEAKEMAKTAKEKGLDYARSSRSTITGIRKGALLLLSGLNYQHDTVSDNLVRVRVFVDAPAKATKDILVSGYVKSDAVNQTKTKFEKYFKNKLTVVSMEQQGDFGVSIRIAAKVDLSGMDTKDLCFYSYDKKANSYRRIANPAYRLDKNGYLYFATEFAGDIVISDGVLIKK